ncbi:unnamed protein product [Phaedon cochleariae]|uniref:Calponin-homology (CH) domain-containing protein n=1 Tax=Phaedon cochleariae TaxID=80249 RepID=A0A9P0DIB2_PHACE|nr:unnamed protein product [Phaedon cochleariae]
MEEEIIEKPSIRNLYRQSSSETRLSPVHLSQEESSDSDDDHSQPKIVDCTMKTDIQGIYQVKQKDQFKMDLEEKLGNKMHEPEFRIIVKSKSSETVNPSKILKEDIAEPDRVSKEEPDNKLAFNQMKKTDQIKRELEKKLENMNKPKVIAEISVNSKAVGKITEPNRVLKEELDDKLKKKHLIKRELEEKLGNVNKSEVITEIAVNNKTVTPSKLLKENTCETILISEGTFDNKRDISEQTYKPQEYTVSGNIGYKYNTVETILLDKEMDYTSTIKDASEPSVGLLKAYRIEKEEEEPSCEKEEEEDDRVFERTFQNKNKHLHPTTRDVQMATLRPKSPAPRPVPVKGEKDESIWDKLGTLGRKKRIKEVQEVQAEGKYAIDSPGCPTAPVIPPEEYNLDDNEQRCMIDPKAYEDQRFLELINVLKEWVNDELASQRIIVQDLSEDLYDGQVLQKLLEKLTGDKLDVPEVTQSEEGQKQKLAVVLNHFNQVLGVQRISPNKWNVEAIHSKNIVPITHLLVALARHFRPPVRLPEHVAVYVVIVQKVKGQLVHKRVRESLTKAYDDVGMRCERDAFDTLIDHAPEKLLVVKKSLVTFVNKHLNKINFEITEIESQFHDGVYLIMLMGLLEGFFVPHYVFHLTPHEFDQKVQNVNFAFELMEEVGLQRPKARPEDVVNMDLKSTLRVLYSLFLRYKTIQ